MYKITLADGIELKDLELNGNNFISNTIISDSIFENNLKIVEISDGENTQIYNDMVLVANRVIDGKSWFILAEKTQEQKEKEALEKCINDIYATLVSKGLKTINDLPNELQSKVSKLIVQQDSIQKR